MIYEKTLKIKHPVSLKACKIYIRANNFFKIKRRKTFTEKYFFIKMYINIFFKIDITC